MSKKAVFAGMLILLLVTGIFPSYGDDDSHGERKVWEKVIMLTASIVEVIGEGSDYEEWPKANLEAADLESVKPKPMRKGKYYDVILDKGSEYGFRGGMHLWLHEANPEFVKMTAKREYLRSFGHGEIIAVEKDRAVARVRNSPIDPNYYMEYDVAKKLPPDEREKIKPIPLDKVGDVVGGWRDMAPDEKVEGEEKVRVSFFLNQWDQKGNKTEEEIASFSWIDNKIIYEKYNRGSDVELYTMEHYLFRPEFLIENGEEKIALPFTFEGIERFVNVINERAKGSELDMFARITKDIRKDKEKEPKPEEEDK